MSTTIVSIITPCYNAGSYLKACIESVIAQTFVDWEMIIVDDCSTDNSADIIKAYQQNDSRIKYFKTPYPSGSPAQPRNIGIGEAKGRYLAFLDADDIWLPDKLTEQYTFALKHNCRFVYSNYEKISESGERKGRIISMKLKTNYHSILKTCSIPCLTAFLDKSIIGDIRFKSIPKEDFVFWAEILEQGYVAYNSGGINALYRESNHSRSSNKLSMIAQQWWVLREQLRINCIPALYYMLVYIICGFVKYVK